MGKESKLDKNVKQYIGDVVTKHTNKIVKKELSNIVSQEMLNNIKNEIEEDVISSIFQKNEEHSSNTNNDKYSKYSFIVSILTLFATIIVAVIGWYISSKIENENNKYLPLNYSVSFNDNNDTIKMKWTIDNTYLDTTPILSKEFKINEHSEIVSGEYQGMYISMINNEISDSRYVAKTEDGKLYLSQYKSDDSSFSLTYNGKEDDDSGEDIKFLFEEKFYVQILQNDEKEKTMIFSVKQNEIDNYKILIISLKGYNKDYQNIALVFTNTDDNINSYKFDENTLHNAKEIQYGMEQLKIDTSKISTKDFTDDLNNQIKIIKESLE